MSPELAFGFFTPMPEPYTWVPMKARFTRAVWAETIEHPFCHKCDPEEHE